jgi:hypothetical protein
MGKKDSERENVGNEEETEQGDGEEETGKKDSERKNGGEGGKRRGAGGGRTGREEGRGGRAAADLSGRAKKYILFPSDVIAAGRRRDSLPASAPAFRDRPAGQINSRAVFFSIRKEGLFRLTLVRGFLAEQSS